MLAPPIKLERSMLSREMPRFVQRGSGEAGRLHLTVTDNGRGMQEYEESSQHVARRRSRGLTRYFAVSTRKSW